MSLQITARMDLSYASFTLSICCFLFLLKSLLVSRCSNMPVYWSKSFPPQPCPPYPRKRYCNENTWVAKSGVCHLTHYPNLCSVLCSWDDTLDSGWCFSLLGQMWQWLSPEYAVFLRGFEMWQKNIPQLLGLSLSTPHFATQFESPCACGSQTQRSRHKRNFIQTTFSTLLGCIWLLSVISEATGWFETQLMRACLFVVFLSSFM